MAVRIQFRRGTAAEWTTANPTLAAGELGFESDTGAFKIGNGSSTWTALPYGAVSESYVDDAIANVVGLAPETLDTLNELAEALGDDPEFLSGINSDIANAITASEEYTDNAIANLVATAPEALNTLNELAAALGDDENFATTVNTALAHRVEYVVDTAANYVSDNPTIDQYVIAMELDTDLFKIGTGSTAWNALPYANESLVDDRIFDHNSQTTSVHGIANVADLVTSSELDQFVTDNQLVNEPDLSNALGAYTTTEILANTYLRQDTAANTYATLSDIEDFATTTQLDLKAPLLNPSFTGTVGLPATVNIDGSSIGNTTGAQIAHLANVTADVQAQIDAKAPATSPTFSGIVSLPTETSIGNVSSTELETLNGVTSGIQSQLDGKLDTSVASTTYAPLESPSFTGTVVLPANTSIDGVSSTEIGYLNGVTSSIQDQLDDKAPSNAPTLNSPTFTGTPTGLTAGMVGLGNVDNTSDLDKPISNATQTALDAKLDLAGGTLTGDLILSADPTQALHAVTKQYVDNISAGLHVHEAVHAATTDTLANLVSSTVTYDNGTNGVGATLTLGANLTEADGHTLNNGDRILVKNEATAAHNGIYVRTSATVLTRADDFNSAAEMAGGDFTFVENGTLYNATGWVVDNEITTVGTDDVVWVQFSGAGTITAGNNISVSGTQVSVVSSPTFTNVSASVVSTTTAFRFADNTIQTSAGVPSLTQFVEKTSNYTLDTLTLIDEVVEVNSSSATTITIPTNATLAWPIGASMDILQTGSGQVTIANAVGVTLNFTPGNKLRTQWSSCTIMKRGTDSWILYGDLTA